VGVFDGMKSVGRARLCFQQICKAVYRIAGCVAEKWVPGGYASRSYLHSARLLAMTETPHYQPLLHIVLHQPEIPHNTGSVGRTCVAAGAKLWLVRPLGFRLDDYYLRRAGLDYWQHLEWEVVDDWKALTERLPAAGQLGEERRPWFLTKTAQRSYADVRFDEGTCWCSATNRRAAAVDVGKNAERLLTNSNSPQRGA
jgi:tRNA(Leu) C34 or U34 (ribose-2'-O)-methylase TrmL